MSYEKVREKIANLIIVDCGYDSEYPCPHAYPAMGYELCPHEDKDICMWQLEQADQILTIIKEDGYVKKAEDQSLPENPWGRGVHLDADVYDGLYKKRYSEAQQDMLNTHFQKTIKVMKEDEG